MSNILAKDILLLRITIIKERRDYYIGKDYKGNIYKLLKTDYFHHLGVGDDRYHYVENLGSALLYKNVLRPLSKSEEYDLLSFSKTQTLADLGISLNSL